MNVVLVYPPVSDPRAPQLALPSLAAYLRPRGVDVDLVDLNAEAPWWFARPDELERLEARLGDDASCAAGLRTVRKHAAWALEALTSELFYDSSAYHAARSVLRTLYRLVGLSTPIPTSLELDPADLRVSGVDPRRLEDLIEATATDDANPFASLYDDFRRRYADRKPGAVGITLTNRQQFLPGLFLARRLHEDGHHVILGGAMISKFAETLRSQPAFFRTFCSSVICYEGERGLFGLLEALQGRGSFSDVPGLLRLERGMVRSNAPVVLDVNELPTPDFSGLPLDRYLAPEPVLPILLGKGCYFNRCKFCDIPHINHISKKAYRMRSPAHVARDVATLHARHGARSFVVTDEAIPPKSFAKIADALDEYPPFERTFTGYARLEDGFSPAAFEAAHRVGFRKLLFGLESASQATIDHMDKGTTASMAGPLLRRCRAAGIAFHVFSIIGFPEETEERIRETFAFMLDNRDTIDHPANSFDIHRFGLEVRSDYFIDRSDYGIELTTDSLGAFAIGLHPDEWTNPRGVDDARLDALLKEEFEPALTATFSTHHARGRNVWPPMEEYAALYASHYGVGHPRRDFCELASLPPAGSPRRFALSPGPLTEIDQGKVRALGSTMDVPAPFLEALLVPGSTTIDAFLNRLGQAVGDPQSQPALRAWVDELVHLGIFRLQRESLPPPPSGFTLAMFRKKELLRRLCRAEADRRGIAPTDADVAHYADRFRDQAGLGDPEAFAKWLHHNGLDAGEFFASMRDLATIELVERLEDSGLRDGMPTYIRLNAQAVAARGGAS
jgi:hypothetical protein